MRGAPILDFALHHLTLARAALYRTLIFKSQIQNAKCQIEAAVDGLRASGNQDDVPRGLLSRALLRFVSDDKAACVADLDEAWQIAERGVMKLHMADVHLHRARLFRDEVELAAARELIEACGYHRRDGELHDAEAAAESWP